MTPITTEAALAAMDRANDLLSHQHPIQADELAFARAHLESLAARCEADAARLDWLCSETRAVVPVDSLNGDAGDADVLWEVRGFYMQAPRVRVLAVADTPRAAIDRARGMQE